MKTLWQDIRYGLRVLAKAPGFTAVAVLTLALGIGASTAIFSVVSAVLLKPLSLPQPERLVKIEERHAGWASTNFTNANFVDIARQTRTLEKLSAYRPWLFSLSGEGEPEDVDGYRVSAQLFNALGIAPLLGRTFSADEDQPGAGGVVVLSNGLWKRRFGADAGIVGKTCKINGVRSQIIGVMPAEFHFLEGAGLWMPLALDDELRTNRRAHLYTVIGRLKSGVTLEQARSEMRTLSAVIDAENKGVDPDC
jgi:putative ABC transport system permease protein